MATSLGQYQHSSSQQQHDDSNVPDVPLALVANGYIEDYTTQMRSRPIPWEGYQRATLITQEELQLIKRVDKKSPEEIKRVMDKDGDQYAKLYINLLQKLVRVETVQYILVLVDDMLTDHNERTAHFHKLSAENPELPFAPFLRCIKMDNDFVPLKASKILTILICSAPNPPSVNFTEFFQWIVTQLQNSNPNVYDLAVQVLESLLRSREYRKLFWETPRGMDSLVNIFQRSPSPQMNYQTIFCLWLLSFEDEYAALLNKQYGIIPTLIDIAKSAIKEKVIRVIVATFRNLVEKAPEQNLPAMLVAKMLPFCENLAGRKWSDQEIMEDIEVLQSILQENFQSLSTFEEYATEIRSRRLEWSPPHQSEQFWKQNAPRLNENDHELLKILARLLSTSSDTTVLAVAAHDIGQYIKHHHAGKKFIQEIGAKQRIMELMTHEDPEVRYQALLAVQKYMTNAWEF
ncbi:uncharacterized protein VTP21DRAFT_7297 [Calcarisporiella thermophila]|uniref:uncharacterized protein n=1 Tax=Calcarisporiella thermophila TaxID=911321 RepID=UPI0037445E5A